MLKLRGLGWLNITLIVLIMIWFYHSFVPPQPKICGTPGGPPITGPRILLRDGRHLSYKEYGVPNEIAKHKIIFIHGHNKNKKDPFLTSEDPFKELQICIMGFDRPGYGESDPHPEQTLESITLDIEELADQLGFGSKFYVMGISSGGAITWGCIKYIPHRLAGVILVNPAINYWWPSLPPSLVEPAIKTEGVWKEWSLSIAHYTPWLFYWWNTQQVFTESNSIYNNAAHDLDINSVSDETDDLTEYSTQQGIYESFYRDEMVVFGKWEFDPLDLENIFGDNGGLLHIWRGEMDEGVSVTLVQYVLQKLSWIQYHEVPNARHSMALDDDIKYQMLKNLVTYETGIGLSTN